MSTTAEPGLRERKKAATRQALHEAAVRLAIEHGADHITVEAIADDAGVSRRTFSNYFGSKEEALLYADYQRIHRLAEIVAARPPQESPWTALSASVGDFHREFGALDQRAVAQSRLLRNHPTLVAAQVQTYAALERELAVEIAARAPDLEPGSVRVKMIAATFLAAMRVSVNYWMEAPSGTDLADIIHEALAEAGRGFA